MKTAKLLGVVCAIGLSGLWQGFASAQLIRDPDAEAAFKQGVEAIGQKDYKSALAALNRALAIDATYTEAFVAKGDALKEIEDYGGAAKAYTDALNFDANSAAAYNGRGEALMEATPPQLDLALNDFYNALELDRNNPKILSNIGHLLVNNQVAGQSDPTAALRLLDDAIALDDADARAYRDRGLAHVRIGEFEKSIADLEKAVEVDPSDYENFSTLATIHLFQSDFEPAIDAIGKAIEAYQPKKRTDPPVFIEGYLMRSDAAQRLSADMDDAAKREAALKQSVADADAVLKVFADRFPQNGIAYYRRGRAQRLLEEYSKAVDSLTKAIQLATGQDPGYLADAYLYRGICFHYIGSEELARGDFQQASASGSGYQDPRVYLWIGFTYHLQEDYREAVKWYAQAVAKNPNFTLAHINRGRAYMDLGDYKKAIESFNDAVRTEPNKGDNYYYVAYAYAKLEEYQKAVDFYDLALLKDDPQPRMYRGMAEALRKLGRDELADKYDRQADEAEAKMHAAG